MQGFLKKRTQEIASTLQIAQNHNDLYSSSVLLNSENAAEGMGLGGIVDGISSNGFPGAKISQGAKKQSILV